MEHTIKELLREDVLKTHAGVLLALYMSDTHGLSPSTITDMLGLTRSSCSMVCRALLESGLVEHRHPIRDLRKVNVYLTATGIAVAQKSAALLSVMGNDLLNDRNKIGSDGNGGEV